MSNEYTLSGYDDRKNPSVATNVTMEQAHAFAKEKGLNGFFLTPSTLSLDAKPTYELTSGTRTATIASGR